MLWSFLRKGNKVLCLGTSNFLWSLQHKDRSARLSTGSTISQTLLFFFAGGPEEICSLRHTRLSLPLKQRKKVLNVFSYDQPSTVYNHMVAPLTKNWVCVPEHLLNLSTALRLRTTVTHTNRSSSVSGSSDPTTWRAVFYNMTCKASIKYFCHTFMRKAVEKNKKVWSSIFQQPF